MNFKMNIILHEPEIPQNTGNIGRTCVATGTSLHLIEPLGFKIDDKSLKRAGMDYWKDLDVHYYTNFQDFLNKNPNANIYMATTKALNTYSDIKFKDDDFIMFGSEGSGIPEEILLHYKDNSIRYTGVTSITGDQSNVGFVLMNQRTMETKFYEIEGATERSAMSSAEGQVQNLHYMATFPLLLNISGEPTYFIALKDNAGLVKKYAMVNVQKYQIVAIGDTVSECEDSYTNLMYKNGIKTEAEDTRSVETLTAKITKIAQGVIDGDSHYYIMLEGSDEIFDVSVVDFIDIIRFNVGDEVTVEYKKGEQVDTVLSLNGKSSEQISTKAEKEEQTEDTAGDSAQTE